MKLHIKDQERAEKFGVIISNMQRFVENIILFFKKDHFYVQGMDFTQTALFEVYLNKDFFDEYQLEDEDSNAVGIKTIIIQKIFNSKNVNQDITISYQGNPDKINISFENITDTSLDIPKYFELPLIEIDTPLLGIPDQEYPLDFSISTKIFSGLINDLLLFGESIKVQCDEDKICMKSKNYDGAIEVKLFDTNDSVEKITDYTIEEDFQLDLDFMNKYFIQFCGFSKLSSMVHLYFSNNMPMQMKYNISDTSYVRFYLTPLVED